MSKTITIPMDPDGADLNWVSWIVVCVDQEGGALDDKEIATLTQSVPLPVVYEDQDVQNYLTAIQQAFTNAGYTLVFSDVAKLVWPGPFDEED